MKRTDVAIAMTAVRAVQGTKKRRHQLRRGAVKVADDTLSSVSLPMIRTSCDCGTCQQGISIGITSSLRGLRRRVRSAKCVRMDRWADQPIIDDRYGRVTYVIVPVSCDASMARQSSELTIILSSVRRTARVVSENNSSLWRSFGRLQGDEPCQSPRVMSTR